ncbi:QacE family quaternary ammonium compound efflux SMR transporter [Vagococcus penaei]|uniref:QacE family quaternary ammonium compound efflux SMR transporter n=1 Tax=Vagococcus penaei TaxID=633807 RepID=A0A1Q2D394_9ENTE|nr:multidrug efflux SMR transporter [Vagococcus penaei]AQP52826.1 QacE family quaternary ammonium compound efflux SMR transporter [Vagococcus penaei]RSU01167.1 QacE family quaternary ammonium compound efflux SMR transporter [Vagococcus penaei]
MKNPWVQVLIASIFEVSWVIGLKHANSLIEWIGTLIAIFLSFYLMIKAGEKIPVGTVYAVFVGLGTVGTTAVGAILFNETVTMTKLFFILLLISGVIGLKASTKEKTKEMN